MVKNKKTRIFNFVAAAFIYIIALIICLLFNLIIKFPTFTTNEIETYEQENDTIPFFSIVIPCYQRKNFIATALKSCIENQDLIKYNLSIEILLIDDNSTDGTLNEIYSAKKRYESMAELQNHVQIKIILNERHRGALYTRSIGLKTATGKYIFSLDSDDEFVPGIFQRIRLLLGNRNDIDLLQFRILICDLKESNNNVTYDANSKKNIYTYKLFAYIDTFPNLQKYAIFNEPINKTKFHIINDNIDKTVSIDRDPHVFHASKEKFRKLAQNKQVMWNLPSLLFRRKLIQSVFESNMLEEEVYNQDVSIHEDYYISYVVFFFVKNFYFLDEIGYIYYRGTPRVKRKRNLRIISQSLMRFNYSDKLPKFRI